MQPRSTLQQLFPSICYVTLRYVVTRERKEKEVHFLGLRLQPSPVQSRPVHSRAEPESNVLLFGETFSLIAFVYSSTAAVERRRGEGGR